MKLTYPISIIALLLLMFKATQAQDRVFARTYQSNVLNKGNFDLEVWSTYSFGREDFFSKLKQRVEFEFGVSNRTQTAFYLNFEQQSFVKKYESNSEIVTASPAFSFSNEWKFKVSDPVADRIGFALYGEFTLSTSEIELEGKLIFDKKINNHLFAANITGEAELEHEFESEENKTSLENEKNKLQLDLAYMHLFEKGWGLGIEMQNRNGFAKGEWKYSALYTGPTLSWHSAKSWWLILNVMPQITNLKAESGKGNLELSSNEKFDVRLLFAYIF